MSPRPVPLLVPASYRVTPLYAPLLDSQPDVHVNLTFQTSVCHPPEVSLPTSHHPQQTGP